MRTISTTRNIWDEEWELGAWSSSGKIEWANHFRNKNLIRVLPNTTYYTNSNLSDGISIYDINNNYLRTRYPNNSTFTTGEDAYYIGFNAKGTTYNHDICINKSDSLNGTYTPHIQTYKNIDYVEYNQLVQNGNFESTSNWLVSVSISFSVSNNIATLSTKSTSQTDVFRQDKNFVEGHKYLFYCKAKKVSGSGTIRYRYPFFSALNTSENWDTFVYIQSELNNFNLFRWQIWSEDENVDFVVQLKNIIVIDLTQLFGTGNEPTTIEQFYATKIGQAVQKYGYLPYSTTNTKIAIEFKAGE